MIKIDGMGFGWITVEGKKHRHDVVIFPSGKVKRRKGGFLMFGSHSFKLKEFEELCAENAEVIVVGTGTNGVAKVSKEVMDFLRKADIELVILPSSEAVRKFNEFVESGKKVGAIIHVTC
jgi:hypothetical protein